MTAPTCARCSRPIQDGLRLCVTCGGELVRCLYAVPAVVADLEVLRTGQDRFTDGGASAEAPLPIRPARTGTQMIGELELNRLTNTVTTWWRVILEESGVIPDVSAEKILALRSPGRQACIVQENVRHHRDGSTVHSERVIRRHPNDIPTPITSVELAAVCLSEVPHLIRKHEAAAQLADEIIAAVTAARRATDRPREMRPIGPCPTVLEDGSACGVALLVDAHEPPAYVRCRACREQVDVVAVERATLDGAADYCYTRPELMLVMARMGEPVSRGTLDSWVSRGRLAEAMRNADGERMFRLGDVRKLRAAGRQDEGGSAA